MSMAISDKISFSKKNILSVSDISISKNGTYENSITDINKKCSYIKIIANVSVSNKELTTDDFHPVAVIFNIKYIDDDDNIQTITDCFYPKYQHEVKNKDTYTIIDLPNDKISSIDIEVINSEDAVSSVNLDKLQVKLKLVVNEDTVKDIVNGGESGSGGSIPVYGDLIIYNTESNFTINGLCNKEQFYVKIPDQYLTSEYMDEKSVIAEPPYGIKISWEITSRNGYTESGYKTVIKPDVGVSYVGFDYDSVATPDDTTEGALKCRVIDGMLKLYALYNDVLDVKCYLTSHPEIYGTCVVAMNNCEINDISLSLDTSDGKIHIGKTAIATFSFGDKDNLISDMNSYYDIYFYTYDNGKLNSMSDKHLSESDRTFSMVGNTVGKIKVVISISGSVPNLFSKSFILDVVE